MRRPRAFASTDKAREMALEMVLEFDQERARPRHGHESFIAAEHALDVMAHWQHREDAVDVRDRLAQGERGLCAIAFRGRHGVGREVEGADREPGLKQISHHGKTHVAQTYERDCRDGAHASAPFPLINTVFDQVKCWIMLSSDSSRPMPLIFAPPYSILASATEN